MVMIEFDNGVYGFKPEDDDPPVSPESLTASGGTDQLVRLITPYLKS